MSVYFLIDCNSFYCSCERIFNPKIQKQPVVVLSNNDGCIVSLTREAKELGITMGIPFFKVRELCLHENVAVFSSNYELYADISRRVMETVAHFTDNYEIYSIDECFVCFDNCSIEQAHDMAHSIKARIWQWCKIPVSIGIGTTKTLAKAANRWAKKNPQYNGVFDTRSIEKTTLLSQLQLTDIWGIGVRQARRLKEQGIYTPLQLVEKSHQWLHKRFNVNVLKTVEELRGSEHIKLKQVRVSKKSIICSRSFSRRVLSLNELKEATATYTTRAVENLRKQQSVCGHVAVFIRSSKYHNTKQYSGSLSAPILPPTNDLFTIVAQVHQLLEAIFKEGIQYARAGVTLLDIHSADNVALSLFDDSKPEKSEAIMEAMTTIRYKYGRDFLRLASAGTKRSWSMKRYNISPCYTTR
jgi:DNA polymerase V